MGIEYDFELIGQQNTDPATALLNVQDDLGNPQSRKPIDLQINPQPSVFVFDFPTVNDTWLYRYIVIHLHKV
jgi:hypothetical protein